jgi:hypothetical protein
MILLLMKLINVEVNVACVYESMIFIYEFLYIRNIFFMVIMGFLYSLTSSFMVELKLTELLF